MIPPPMEQGCGCEVRRGGGRELVTSLGTPARWPSAWWDWSRAERRGCALPKPILAWRCGAVIEQDGDQLPVAPPGRLLHQRPWRAGRLRSCLPRAERTARSWSFPLTTATLMRTGCARRAWLW